MFFFFKVDLSLFYIHLVSQDFFSICRLYNLLLSLKISIEYFLISLTQQVIFISLFPVFVIFLTLNFTICYFSILHLWFSGFKNVFSKVLNVYIICSDISLLVFASWGFQWNKVRLMSSWSFLKVWPIHFHLRSIERFVGILVDSESNINDIVLGAVFANYSLNLKKKLITICPYLNTLNILNVNFLYMPKQHRKKFSNRKLLNTFPVWTTVLTGLYLRLKTCQ